MSRPGSITATVPFVVAQAVRRRGGDGDAVLRAAGLGTDRPPRVEDHVPVARYVAAWRAALATSGDQALPLAVAAASQLEDNEVFGFLAISCETLAEAFAKTAAYRALYVVGARWELDADANATRLVWHPWPALADDEGARAAVDFQVADMIVSVRRLGAVGPRPLRVRLARPAPPDAAPYEALFGVVPTFASPRDEVVYGPDLGAQRVATFNSRLRDYFDAQCKELLARGAGATSVIEAVRQKLVMVMDGGDTSIEAIARQLGMSARTLQRRLGEEGARYQTVLDEVRAEFAKRYLARRTLSASEVAYLVGFTEPPAFFKAFKRWTGMTPGAFQEAS